MAESTLALFIPFMILTVVANLSDRYPIARIATYLGLVMLNLLLMFGGALIVATQLLSRMLGDEAAPEMAAALGSADWTAAGAVFFLTGLLAFLPLLPPVRRGLARLFPIDPESYVHLTALVLALYLVGNSIATLWLIPLIASGDQGALLTPSVIWTQELAFALIGALGVGLFTRRSLRGVLERLKLERPSVRQLLGGLGVVIALLGLSWFISTVWNRLDPGSYEQVGRISEALFGGLTSPIGVLSLGLAAGIGEETLFRGALQPRFGLPLTAFLFMIAHTQYTISPALIELFVVGWVLGMVRDRSNTTVCILIHAFYNILSVILAPLFP